MIHHSPAGHVYIEWTVTGSMIVKTCPLPTCFHCACVQCWKMPGSLVLGTTQRASRTHCQTCWLKCHSNESCDIFQHVVHTKQVCTWGGVCFHGSTPMHCPTWCKHSHNHRIFPFGPGKNWDVSFRSCLNTVIPKGCTVWTAEVCHRKWVGSSPDHVGPAHGGIRPLLV